MRHLVLLPLFISLVTYLRLANFQQNNLHKNGCTVLINISKYYTCDLVKWLRALKPKLAVNGARNGPKKP